MKKLKGILIKLFIMAIIAFIILIIIISENTGERIQYLNNLDYNVVFDETGNMHVTETWDIYIENTNTLFKTFNLSKTKFGNIVNPKVVDLETGEELTQIHEEMYHVTEDCYYGLEINSHQYEIAWGVGLDNGSDTRKYQISYTVNDVVTDYKDMQEIYWQFLGKGQNSVPAKKVTGSVKLPIGVENLEKLRVWGHGQISGEIHKVNNSQVEFNIDNLNPGAMIEIRIVTEDKIFDVYNINKIRNYRYLNSLLKEEEKWATETNNEVEERKNFIRGFIIIYIFLIVIYCISILKYFKIKNNKNNNNNKKEIKYYREIPREKTSTPGEASYLYKFYKERLTTQEVQSQAIAATILDLCLKKKITLRPENKKVYVSIIADEVGLKEDEEKVYKLLKEASKGKEEFEIEELNKFAKKEYDKYSYYMNKIVNAARNSLYNLKLIDKVNEKIYLKCKISTSKSIIIKYLYEFLWVMYFVSIIPSLNVSASITFGMGYETSYLIFLITLIPMVALMLYKWNIQEKIQSNIAVLTESGEEEKAQWKGLKTYIEEYSLIEDREVIELALWEKYLVYGTAFGIADKVIEQMKANYPEVFIEEAWDDEKMMNEYPVIYFTANPIHVRIDNDYSPIKNISNNVNKAYHTSMTEIAKHSSSSGSGRRRRFLWRRRRPEVAGGRNGW